MTQYQEFCSVHGLRQLIKSPTRITENKSSLLDVLTNSREEIPQVGMIDIDVSDHQLIYCTGKVLHPKTNGHERIKIPLVKPYQCIISDL